MKFSIKDFFIFCSEKLGGFLNYVYIYSLGCTDWQIY